MPVALWRFVATGGAETLFETLRLAISREEVAGAASLLEDVAAAPATRAWAIDALAEDDAGKTAESPDPAADAAPASSVERALFVPPPCGDATCIRASAEWNCESAMLSLEGEQGPPDASLEIYASTSLLGVVSSDGQGSFRIRLPLERRAERVRFELRTARERSASATISVRDGPQC